MADIRKFINKAVFFFILLKYVTIMPVSGQIFYKGVDLSYVNELEQCGATYRDKDGKEKDPYAILANSGANLVRLRLWHNPQWTNYSNLEDVKTSIRRAKSANMPVLLDFHYSDFWVDPGRQWRPEAWENIDNDAILADSVYSYTYKVLSELNRDDLLPNIVQIGNETNGNILIKRGETNIGEKSPGLYPVDWERQVTLLQKGIHAVLDFNKANQQDVQTIIHVADPRSASSWFKNAATQGLKNFDIIGLSYYPQFHDLGVREVGDIVASLINENTGKQVMIVEVGYPFTSRSGDQAGNVLGTQSRRSTYSNLFSTETQRDFLIELSRLVKDNGGIGMIYWEPAWISTPCRTYWGAGSHWENATLFDFEGKLHSGADFLSYDYSQKPAALEDHSVTFKVDMTNIDTSNGVFVTGDFTGEKWSLIPMTPEENGIFTYSTTIPGRSAGAYIFYNRDVALTNTSYREKVPTSCAPYWGTHREYIVKETDEEFYYTWSRCDTIPTEQPLALDLGEATGISIYPTIVRDELTIDAGKTVKSIRIIDLNGREQQFFSSKNRISLTQLPSGIYLLNLATEQGLQTYKFLKK